MPDPFSTDAVTDRPTARRHPISYLRGAGHLAVEDAIEPLAATGKVFQRGNQLVQVCAAGALATENNITREASAPIIMSIASGGLWCLLSSSCAFSKYDGRAKKEIAIDPPGQVVHGMLRRGEWPGMPELRGLSTIPILHPDSSIETRPGYDPESGLYYAPNCKPVIPGSPDRMDAEEAAEELLKPVRDFPFAEPYHRSAWLSTVLSRVARPAFDGGIPLTMIDSNTPGTGKSLLADVTSVLSTGLLAARSPYVADDDELRKRIMSQLMRGDQLCLIDNVPGGSAIGWPSLDSALTAGVWTDRELGRTHMLRIPMTSSWFVTGNNLRIRADAARRTMKIRLETELARPEERTGFQWDPLLPELYEARPWLLGHALNLTRAYMLAGRPDVGATSIGSFEGWSRLIRSAIIWAGLPDPALALANRDDWLDEEAEAHIALLENWELLDDLSGRFGLTTTQVLAQIERRKGDLEQLDYALSVLCPVKYGDITPKLLTKRLTALSGRVRETSKGPMKLVRARHQNQAHWFVTVVKPDLLKSPQSPNSESNSVPNITTNHLSEGGSGVGASDPPGTSEIARAILGAGGETDALSPEVPSEDMELGEKGDSEAAEWWDDDEDGNNDNEVPF